MPAFTVLPASQSVASGASGTFTISWPGGGLASFSLSDGGAGGTFHPTHFANDPSPESFDYDNADGTYSLVVTCVTGGLTGGPITVTLIIGSGIGTIVFADGAPGEDGIPRFLADAAPGVDALYSAMPISEGVFGSDAFLLAGIQFLEGAMGGDGVIQNTPYFGEGPMGDDAFYTRDLAKLIDGFGGDLLAATLMAPSEGAPGVDGLNLLQEFAEGAWYQDDLISLGQVRILAENAPGAENALVAFAVRVLSEDPLPSGEGLRSAPPGTDMALFYEVDAPGATGRTADSIGIVSPSACSLVGVPCSNPAIIINPKLVWPPPFIFGFGHVPGVYTDVPVTFDFTSLLPARLAAIEYFTYTISSRAHDWAAVTDATMVIKVKAFPMTYFWGGSEFLHRPPPDIDGYYAGSGTPTQHFDLDLRTNAFDQSPSAGFAFDRYFAQRRGALQSPLAVLGDCGPVDITFGLQLFFAYVWQPGFPSPFDLAYNTNLTPPQVTISDLTAWCCPLQEWNCTDPCEPTAIASGHTGHVCLQAQWMRTVDTFSLSGPFGRPPGMFAPLTLGPVDITNCSVDVIVGCLTPEMIAANHFVGPYTVTIVSAQHCVFDGVDYTRVYVGAFSVTHDVTCGDTPPGGAAQTVLLKQHTTGHVAAKNR